MFLKLLIVSGLSIGVLCAAEAGADIEKAKQRATEHLNKEIKVLEDAKTCVNAAKNKAELTACREKAKIDLKAAKASK
jgi:hypothetical protein